jgi:hypothetical protein
MSSNGTTHAIETDAQRELAELRKQRAALATARAKREAERGAADELEAERRALADEQAIESAEVEHSGKKLAYVHTDMGVIILKRSNALLFKRFQDQGKFKSKDVEILVRPCLVYPSADAFDRIVDELPAVLIECGNAVARLAGQRTEDLQGK